ncbi:hypothetical protein [Spirochaeta isovalerica]|uniref:SCP2 domain-containing protein n=1 Tax=Spirochaeta isovalerica TaxID=150 RepID=A0A841RDE9_9SPIO|nr:hypothetical protein [Spirochaeta isovalerica]MBB6481411.1 hypothetical protein [Spirochaeta isovalerica]
MSVLANDEIYANRIFLNSVLPLLKVIVEEMPVFGKLWEGVDAVCQVSALGPEEKVGTHFLIEEGKWTVKRGIYEGNPHVELEFPSVSALNLFFQGKSKKLPKMKGWYRLGLFLKFMRTLLKMAALLGMEEPPENEEEKALLVKMYFYLLSAGISQLNKAGHPEISSWIKMSPDRVYAWEVETHPGCSAYMRVKAGKSKACRGIYQRSKPFFTMRFANLDSALGILMSIDDMIEATVKGRIKMVGSPEYGARIGDYMLIVGDYAK